MVLKIRVTFGVVALSNNNGHFILMSCYEWGSSNLKPKSRL